MKLTKNDAYTIMKLINDPRILTVIFLLLIIIS
jgi:hypothetical protein